jgi:hypothetical protein
MDGRGEGHICTIYCTVYAIDQGSIPATSDIVGCRVADEAVLQKITQNRLHTTQATNTAEQNSISDYPTSPLCAVNKAYKNAAKQNFLFL